MNRVWQLILLLIMLCLCENIADACAGCWAGYGPGAERFNKALADLRITYEAQGKDALPQIKNVLKTSNDPLVQKRAIEYIAALEDKNSVSLLEDLVAELIKRVSFSSFGVGSIPFLTRLTAAHTLANLGTITMADKIWQRYERLDFARKSEVPYILNAIGDPRLTERLIVVVNRCEDHQLMVGALDVLAMGGNEEALSFLNAKVHEWQTKRYGTHTTSRSFSSLEYSIWKIKAQQAMVKIEARSRH